MAQKRCTGKALAERRRRAMQLIRKRGQAPYTLYEVDARYTTSGSQSPFPDSHLHRAGFTQEEIAEKVGARRSVVARDLQWIRDSSCPGQSPDVQEACFIQIERMKFDPEGPHFDPRHPPLAGTSSPEDAAASWNERRIYNPLVNRYGPN
ncbi:MAG: hypothetical protein ACLQNE_11215 [Thermoguttaceae bacterium]